MKRLLHVMRSPEPADAGGGDPFEGYESGETTELAVGAPPEGDEPGKAKGDDAPITIEQTPEEIAAAEAAAAIEVEETDDERTEREETTFTLKDLADPNLPPLPGEEEYSWKDIASELDLEVADDTIESFKESYTQKLSAVESEAEAKFLEKEKGYSADTIRYITALNNGATELELFEVERPYRDFLSEKAENKIVQAAVANGKTEAQGLLEYERHIEEGTLEDTVEAIDNSVRNKMILERNKTLDGYKQLADQNLANKKAEIARENDLILKAIDARKDYNGVPLSEDVKKVLKARWVNGDYRKAFEKNPNDVTEAILNKELGQKISEKKVSDAAKSTRRELQGKLHNLETAKESTRRASGQQGNRKEIDPEDPFKDFHGFFPEDGK